MSRKLYRVLLLLYPRRFRSEFGPGLLEAFEARRRSMGLFRFWSFHLRDLVVSLTREHVDQLRRTHRGSREGKRGFRMSILLQDLRYALRTVRKRPGFAAVVVLTLALGIGLTTTVFSVTNGVLLRPLQYPDSDALVWGYSTFSGGTNAAVSPPDFLDYREQNTTFEQLAGRRGAGSYALTGMGPAEQVRGQTVTAGFFEVLGGVPVIGRSFTRADETVAASRIVILSHGFWQRAFAGAADVLERSLVLDGTSYQVVGVMPSGFRLFSAVDFWTPLPFDNEFNQIRRFHNLRLVGRLRPGETLESAQAELDVISQQLEEQYPASNATWRLVITPLREILVGFVRPALLVLLGAVGFVLLIACGNVANLILARGATRRVELGVRAALGASRGRIVHQLLVENMVLGLMGGLLGLGLAYGGIGVLRNLNPQNLPRLEEVTIDLVVLLFALGLSAATTFVFGLFPSITAGRVDINTSLARGGRSGHSGGGRMRGALVSVEIALALMLLVGAGLLIRSFAELTDVQPGFETDNRIAATISLASARYETEESRIAFFEELQRELRAVPGVVDVGWINILPMSGSGNDTYLAVPGRHQLGTDTQFNALTRTISSNYFDVMGMPLVRGRTFTEADRAGTDQVVIIDEPFAQTIFPDEDPIGQRLHIDFGEVYEAEIVGVVGGVHHFSLAGTRGLTFYLPSRQIANSNNTVVMRTSVDPAGVMASVGQVVADIDPLQPVASTTMVSDLIDQSVAQPRFQMLLLTIFAAVAVSLAAIGIYGILGYYVAQRRREVGLRIALGAQSRDVYALILKRALAYTGTGLVVGLIGALAVTRLMSNLLFGVVATDLLTFALVPLILALVALCASYVPARRALRIDPMGVWRDG